MLRKAVKKGVKAGLKVAVLSMREGIRVLRPLVRKGKLSRGDARRAARMLVRVADQQRRRADALIQRTVTAEIKRLGFVHKSELRKKRR